MLFTSLSPGLTTLQLLQKAVRLDSSVLQATSLSQVKTWWWRPKPQATNPIDHQMSIQPTLGFAWTCAWHWDATRFSTRNRCARNVCETGRIAVTPVKRPLAKVFWDPLHCCTAPRALLHCLSTAQPSPNNSAIPNLNYYTAGRMITPSNPKHIPLMIFLCPLNQMKSSRLSQSYSFPFALKSSEHGAKLIFGAAGALSRSLGLDFYSELDPEI